uniref:Uncharacterized protein n=1 Tax=Physcomitrium patens TaxID=3218 RepID=A0A2K1KWL6_PHYPA|nr:hypothetical protein PHYPA_005135 [Physcomitrium patens]
MTEKKPERVPYWEAFRLDRTWQPGPKLITKTKSACFGPQILSKRITSPCIGFGTGSRYAFQKMFVNNEMAAKAPGNNSPGPVYKLSSSFGKQTESHYESQAEVKIGTAKRFFRRVLDNAPGPGAYNPRGSAFGEQEKWGLVSPGPDCPQKSAFGLQNRSGNRTAPIVNFTKGLRNVVFTILVRYSNMSQGQRRRICWTRRIPNKGVSWKAI